MNPILISNPTNIRYLTGFTGLSPTEREAYVLMTDTVYYLFINALYTEEVSGLTNPVNGHRIQPVELSREHPLSQQLATICEKESFKDLAFEEMNLTVAEFEQLKKALTQTTLTPSRNRIEDKRKIKSADEIAHIRTASELTDACFTYILPLLVSGVYETAIAQAIESYFKKEGADIAFSPIVAFGANTSMPHYTPQNRGAQLQQYDMVLLDFGAKVHGYCSDMTRVVFIGGNLKEHQQTYNTLLAAQLKALTLLSDGERNGKNLDSETRAILEQASLPTYPHSLGHALGLDIHEAPRIHKDIDATIESGMVITIEPGVYVAGSYGMRIEDTVLITDTGIEILTRSPKELLVI